MQIFILDLSESNNLTIIVYYCAMRVVISLISFFTFLFYKNIFLFSIYAQKDHNSM